MEFNFLFMFAYKRTYIRVNTPGFRTNTQKPDVKNSLKACLYQYNINSFSGDYLRSRLLYCILVWKWHFRMKMLIVQTGVFSLFQMHKMHDMWHSRSMDMPTFCRHPYLPSTLPSVYWSYERCLTNQGMTHNGPE